MEEMDGDFDAPKNPDVAIDLKQLTASWDVVSKDAVMMMMMMMSQMLLRSWTVT